MIKRPSDQKEFINYKLFRLDIKLTRLSAIINLIKPSPDALP